VLYAAKPSLFCLRASLFYNNIILNVVIVIAFSLSEKLLIIFKACAKLITLILEIYSFISL
jgi:hypothetical protein